MGSGIYLHASLEKYFCSNAASPTAPVRSELSSASEACWQPKEALKRGVNSFVAQL